MTTKSKYRGIEIEYNGEGWIYADTKQSVEKTKRACGNCGKHTAANEHDICISNLPGVMNACCGHGNDDSAYIQFWDKKEIRGKQARKIQLELLASDVEINHVAEKTSRYNLWKFFSDEHGLTLTECQLDDIMQAVNELQE